MYKLNKENSRMSYSNNPLLPKARKWAINLVINEGLPVTVAAQRRIRLGRKNDNAHIERFNRTIQDEALGRWPKPSGISGQLGEYLEFYNNKRLHCSLQGKTPAKMVAKVLS